MLKLGLVDSIVLVGYLVLMVGMMIYFSRRNKDTENYFLGGRSIPGWAIGLSLVGTSISSMTFLAYPADSFKTSWIRYLICLGLPFAMIIALKFFLPIFRKVKGFTAYEFLEKRFGPSIRCYGALTFILTQVVRTAIILYLLSLLFQHITGLEAEYCILIAGICITLYTVVGGIAAVIWTDVLQTIVLLIGGIVCVGIVVGELPGGLSQLFSVAIEHHKFSFSELNQGQLHPIPWGLSLQTKTYAMLFLLGLFTHLTLYSSDQNTIQRYFAAKDDKQARKALLVQVCVALPTWACFMFLGTALFVFFAVFPSVETSQMLSGARKAEEVMPFFIMNYLPAGISGLVIAGAFSAAMSTLDTSINSMSTVMTLDIYKRYFIRDRNDRHYLKAGWFFASLSGAIMIGGAMVLITAETKTLMDTTTILISIVSGGILGIYLLGFFTKVGDARAVGIGLLCTVVFSTWAILSDRNLIPNHLSIHIELYYTVIINNIIMFVVAYLSALLLPSRKEI